MINKNREIIKRIKVFGIILFVLITISIILNINKNNINFNMNNSKLVTNEIDELYEPEITGNLTTRILESGETLLVIE